MKEQTYLVKFTDSSWNMIYFERFSYKRLSSVIRAINKLWSSALYRVGMDEVTQAVIIQTPYGDIEKLVEIIPLKA